MSRKLKVPCVAAQAERRIDIARRYAVLPTAIVVVIAWLDVTSAQSQSTQTYVSGVGRDTQACTAQAPCKTFQAALAKTAAGGRIYVLDSAEYGPITITKSISIIGGGKASGVLAASGASGITVAAGPTDTITLEGLTIDGAGSGVNGVLFTSGAALNVKNSLIRGFQTGLSFQPGVSSVLSVEGTKFTNNTTGVSVETGSSSPTQGVLSDIQIVGNGVGLSAKGQSTGEATVLLHACLISDNDTVGIRSAGYSVVAVANCDVSNNALGLEAINTGAALRIAGTAVASNGIGSQTSNGGQITSAQSNFSQSALVQPAQLPPPSPPGPTGPSSDPFATWNGTNEPGESPPAVTKNIVTDFGATCNGAGNDNAAFAAFNKWALTWQQSNQGLIELVIPAGVCMFTNTSGIGSEFTKNIKKLRISGYGATLSDNAGTGNGYFLGSGRFAHCIAPAAYGDYVNGFCDNARTQTVAAGSKTLTLINSGDAANFSVNSWAMMTGIDLQGCGGAPPNNHFIEYVYITGINGATITLRDPLKYGYKSTWPLYCPGSNMDPDDGGPATLRQLRPEWDIEHEYRGIRLAQDAAVNAMGRSVTIRDCSFGATQTSVSGGINPSVVQYMKIINCDGAGIQIEVDKLAYEVLFQGGTYRRIHVQSSSVEKITLDRTTVSLYVLGSPKNLLVTNSQIETLYLGAQGYGASNEVVVENSVVNSVLPAATSITHRANLVATMNGGVITFPAENNSAIATSQTVPSPGNLSINGSTVSAGIATFSSEQYVYIASSGNNTAINFTIYGTDFFGNPIQETIPGGNGTRKFSNQLYKTVTQVTASGATNGTVTMGAGGYVPPPWAVPGAIASIAGRFTNEYSFTVTDITQDASGVHVHTTMTGGWPTLPTNWGDGIYSIRAHAAPKVTFKNVTGTGSQAAASLSQCSPGLPFGSCQKYIYSGNIGTSSPYIPVQGNLISAKVNVTKAYTGAQSTLNMTFNGPFVMKLSDNTVEQWNSTTINLKQAGERVVTPSNVTGTRTGDNITSPGIVRVFDNQIAPYVATDITAECVANPAVCPTVTIEILTDQSPVN